MAYVIAEPCIGTKDNSCVEVCPVDCIHPTPDEPDYDKVEMLYIDPEECIDCDACVEACPVDACFAEDQLPGRVAALRADQLGVLREHVGRFGRPRGACGAARRLLPHRGKGALRGARPGRAGAKRASIGAAGEQPGDDARAALSWIVWPGATKLGQLG